jgi:hypothetical protein
MSSPTQTCEDQLTFWTEPTLPRIVALSGVAGSGKTTAADYLGKRYGYVRVKFADPIKDMLRAIGLTDRHLEGDLKEKPQHFGKSPRFLLQTLGTEWARDTIHQDFWVNIWCNRVWDLLKQGKRVVVDDVRFANEILAVRALQGAIYRVETVRVTATANKDHSSENPISGHCAIIHNNDSIENLYAQIDKLLTNDQAHA